MRKISGILAMLVSAFVLAFAPANADDDNAALKEYQVKAVFLYNFIKFVEWPGAQALAQTHAANICVIGEDPFGPALNVFKQASTAQLALNVTRNISDAAIPRCHILFISKSEEGRVSQILSAVRGYPVLTVSEISGFADAGGIVEMANTEKSIGLFSKNKINLRINVKLATAAGMRIDAQLLEIASEVIK